MKQTNFYLSRFCVYDEDMFGDPNFLGAATLPALCLLSGYRFETRFLILARFLIKYLLNQEPAAEEWVQ